MNRFVQHFLLICLIVIFTVDNGFTQTARKNFTVSGYIKNARNGEPLVSAVIWVKEIKSGVVPNLYGFYSISLPEGKYLFRYSGLGFRPDSLFINLYENKTINRELIESVTELSTITVRAENDNANITLPEMSFEKLDIKTIRQIPALMGEVDIIKAIQMLPGVQPTSEGTSGYSVRGGSYDQNLILLDEAVVYNASHLMGFFSVFNNDAIRDVKLYKGDIPAEYGSRLSSVLDVRMKEGNNKSTELTGGIGLISSRLTLEGPIVNENTSYLVSARRTYADIFFPLFPDSGLKKSKMYFYDLNLKINRQINKNNRLFLSAYSGRDIFGQGPDVNIGFGNQTATLRWNHLFSERLFMNFSSVYAKYSYSLYMLQGGAKYHWNSTLKDFSIKADFDFFLNQNNEIRFGVNSIYHDFDLCDAWIENPADKLSLPYPKKYALDHAAYISNRQTINPHLTVKYGLRFSLFQNIGPGEVYRFDDAYRETGKDIYSDGKIFNSSSGFEPRIGATYTFNGFSSFKASYSHTIQYMQLASNSTGSMPLDVWFPSSPNVKPQKAHQIAAGYFRNFSENLLETSAEAYYKIINDVIDFKDHPVLLMNPRMEGEIRTGTGRAYGIELMLKKNKGRLTGWVSFTLSKTLRKIKEINDGRTYPAPYDKPLSINAILSYEVSKRLTASLNWIYATGAPVTFPVGTFVYNNAVNKIYSSRNGYRMRDYHRLDFSLTLREKPHPNRLWQGEWVFSVYNAYARHNDWIINFIQDEKNPDKIIAERWYLPFVFFPGITYNFNFNLNKK